MGSWSRHAIQPSLLDVWALDSTQHADIGVKRNQEQPPCILAPSSKVARAIARATEIVFLPHAYTPRTTASVYLKAVPYPIAARLETCHLTSSMRRILPNPQITPTPGEDIHQTLWKQQILKIRIPSSLLRQTRLSSLKTRLLWRAVFRTTSIRVGIYKLLGFLTLLQWSAQAQKTIIKSSLVSLSRLAHEACTAIFAPTMIHHVAWQFVPKDNALRSAAPPVSNSTGSTP